MPRIVSNTQKVAAQLSEISTVQVKTLVFVTSGALAGLALLCQTARLGANDPSGGVGLERSAIAAAVIGGTSLSGGKGSVVCTFLLACLSLLLLEEVWRRSGLRNPLTPRHRGHHHLCRGGGLCPQES